MKMNIGEKIKEMRKRSGYTQKQLAEESGLSEISIKKYETGKVNPKYDSLEKICNVLEIDMKEALSDKNISVSINEDGEIVVKDVSKDSVFEYIQLYVMKNYNIGELLEHENKLIFQMMIDMYISFSKNVNKVPLKERFEIYERGLDDGKEKR